MKPQHKTQLSREKIISQGLALAREQGADQISFRKLAGALEVTPMALYRYFDNKQELLGELLDAFILQADVVPDNALPWQSWLKSLATCMHQALSQQASWVPVFPHLQLKPAALGVMQECINILQQAGFSRQQAGQAFMSLIYCLLGAVTMQASEEQMQQSLQLLIHGLEQQLQQADT